MYTYTQGHVPVNALYGSVSSKTSPPDHGRVVSELSHGVKNASHVFSKPGFGLQIVRVLKANVHHDDVRRPGLVKVLKSS